jgi:hypothetical protein
MEQWRDIPGFEGRYQVSDEGRVRSVDRYVRAVSKAGEEYQRAVKGVVLRPGSSRGYLIVNLHPAGTIAVHRLVALAFVPGYAVDLDVNHKDGVKANCCADNLEWVTRKGNQLHAVAIGLNAQAVAVVAPSGQAYPSISQGARAEGVRPSTARQWAVK